MAEGARARSPGVVERSQAAPLDTPDTGELFDEAPATEVSPPDLPIEDLTAAAEFDRDGGTTRARPDLMASLSVQEAIASALERGENPLADRSATPVQVQVAPEPASRAPAPPARGTAALPRVRRGAAVLVLAAAALVAAAFALGRAIIAS